MPPRVSRFALGGRDPPDYPTIAAPLDRNVVRPDFANTPETYDCAFTLAILPGRQWRPVVDSKAA